MNKATCPKIPKSGQASGSLCLASRGRVIVRLGFLGLICNCSMFCCALLYVHSSFAIILMWKREVVALLCFFFLVSCCVPIPRGAMGLSAFCDCGIS